MASRQGSWADTIREVVDASRELLAAESARLIDQLRGESRRLLVVLLLFTVAAMLCALGLAAILFGIGLALTQVVPAWAAALILAAGLFMLSAILLWLGRSRWLRLESPFGIASQRWEDHRAWWEREIGATPAVGAGVEEGSSEGENSRIRDGEPHESPTEVKQSRTTE